MTDPITRAAEAFYRRCPTEITREGNAIRRKKWAELTEQERFHVTAAMRAAINFLTKSGMVMVPMEPTTEMERAGFDAAQYEVMPGRTYSEYSSDPPELSERAARICWAAMVSARPAVEPQTPTTSETGDA